MIEKKIYKLKEEFFILNNIPVYQWKRRRQDLLNWLANFYDYELIEEKPLRIKIVEVYGEYESMPRKVRDYKTEEKVNDYEEFTIAALGTEFKPNSKSKVAKEAIKEFGYEKYHHTSHEAVSKRYIKPAFDKYGESTSEHYWVWYSTYELLDEETLQEWRRILREEHISEEEAANAFYKQEMGEDISKEKSYFEKARERFKEKYGENPILVQKWKVKDNTL